MSNFYKLISYYNKMMMLKYFHDNITDINLDFCLQQLNIAVLLLCCVGVVQLQYEGVRSAAVNCSMDIIDLRSSCSVPAN